MNQELFKTIEAQGRLITELRAENEELKKELKKCKGWLIKPSFKPEIYKDI